MRTEWTCRRAVAAGVAVGTALCAWPSGLAQQTSQLRAPAIAPSLQAVPVDAAAGSGQPHLSVTDRGDAVLSWLEPAGAEGVTRLRVAELPVGEGAWRTPRTVAEGPHWFVNWADVPSVVPITDTTWAAHWLEKSDPTAPYAYDVRVVMSQDRGRTWSTPMTPHDDGTKTEHGFLSFFPWPGAENADQQQRGARDVGMVWLDGRAMTSAGGHDGHGGGDMALRAARLTEDGSLRDGTVLDPRVCECCPTAALTTGAGAVVAYRNRADDETRDIHVVRWDRGWQRDRVAVADDWTIAACPVNGPALAVSGGMIALAWFTAREDRPRVQLAFSNDHAATWSPASVIDNGRPLGRIGLASHPRGGVVVTWVEAESPGATVRVRHVGPDRTLGPSLAVAKVASTRVSGYPRIVTSGDAFVLAWVEGAPRHSRVQTARLPVSAVR